MVCVDLPGIKREDVQVEIAQGQLTIEGERREQSSESGQGFHRSERSYGRFYRAIPLPAGIDPGAAQASMEEGVLEISIPSPQPHQQGRRLEIGGGGSKP